MNRWSRQPLDQRHGSPSKRIGLTLTEATVVALRRMADEDAVSASELVRDLIVAENARRTAAAHAEEDMWTT